jgi:hypothetical protein
LAGLAASGTLLWMEQRPGAHSNVLYAAVISFVVTIVWGVQYAVLSGHALIRKLGRRESTTAGVLSPRRPGE